MNEGDQRLYRIIYTGRGSYYNIMADNRCIAEAIDTIGELANAIFCDYTGISANELFVDDTEIVISEKNEKILRDLRRMFIRIKMKENLRGYKICGILIGECIDESKRSKIV